MTGIIIMLLAVSSFDDDDNDDDNDEKDSDGNTQTNIHSDILVVLSFMGFCKETITHIITITCICNILQFFMDVKVTIIGSQNCDIFLNFAQNIDCGYTLEPPH